MSVHVYLLGVLVRNIRVLSTRIFYMQEYSERKCILLFAFYGRLNHDFIY